MPYGATPWYSAAALGSMRSPPYFVPEESGDDEQGELRRKAASIQKGSFENAKVSVTLGSGVTNVREGKLEFDVANPHYLVIDGKKLAIGVDQCGVAVTQGAGRESGVTLDKTEAEEESVDSEKAAVEVESKAQQPATIPIRGRKVRIDIEEGDDATFMALQRFIKEAEVEGSEEDWSETINNALESFAVQTDAALDSFADRMDGWCDGLEQWLDSWSEDPATSLAKEAEVKEGKAEDIKKPEAGVEKSQDSKKSVSFKENAEESKKSHEEPATESVDETEESKSVQEVETSEDGTQTEKTKDREDWVVV